ncbi:hypothetical protein BDW02DRAFT_520072 [Decorospora gaudefroyi]|uniref:FAD-binding FR-type domain-containing protein n=1 Tax=Decorospora gaudefroyi TaxID=184978 RepID=A0A6A5KFH5_9PLEO|nr:hypothetical protein BDW02DRAFT_520072 [Decorospora gaudefroyi]
MDEHLEPWLRSALHFALTATASTESPWSQHVAGDVVDPDDPGRDPRFKKLVEAILFSRRLMNTYNLVLGGVLLVFTIWHWGEKVVLLRRRQRMRRLKSHQDTDKDANEAVGDGKAWSSSSSTSTGGSATPPPDTKTRDSTPSESSPLLSPPHRRRPQRRLWRPYYLLKSTLQYQPKPLPLVHKTLPTNATSLLILCWLGLVLFYNFYAMPLSFTYLFVFADRCGIIFITNLPLLYLLAAKNQPIQWLTGYSYESLNIFHRRVGEVICVQAGLHFVGMVCVWYGLLRHVGFTLVQFLFNRVVLLGLAALVAYQGIFFTSLASFRQRAYELFLVLHVLLQAAGLAFLWFHHASSRPYVGVSLGIFLLDRVVFRLWVKSSTHPATLTLLPDDETILVSANWELGNDGAYTSRVMNSMGKGWKPNQHVFLSVPALSRKHALQSHPFTIFSAAPTMTRTTEGDDVKHAWFSLLIRAQSEPGFTHTLLQHARNTSQTRIRLDGPYGSSHALDLLASSTTAIVIAGGSGIAVAYPLLYSLLEPPLSTSDPESASTTTAAAAAPKSCPNKVKLLWITHAPNHRLWIPEDKLKELQDWGLHVLIPPPTALAGRPDAASVVRHWVQDEVERTGVVVSGPDGLVRDVRNACAGLVGKGVDVDVQVEKFGW